MTFREKLEKEHPEYISGRYVGCCKKCPASYGYTKESIDYSVCAPSEQRCRECWDREIPEETTNRKTMLELHKEEILKFIKKHGHSDFGVDKKTGKIIMCRAGSRCEICVFDDELDSCIEKRIQWFNSYEQESAEPFEMGE